MKKLFAWIGLTIATILLCLGMYGMLMGFRTLGW